MLWRDAFPSFPAPASPDRWAATIQTSDVKTRAEIKVTYWLRRKAIDVFVEISILNAKKWTTVNAPPDAGYGQPCHGPQSCCGGTSVFFVSVVGNIDVAK